MALSRLGVVLSVAFCFMVPAAECQRQVFALIPLDGSPFAGRPQQKTNLANGAALSNGTNVSPIIEVSPTPPTPLPNSAAISTSEATESTSTSTSTTTTATTVPHNVTVAAPSVPVVAPVDNAPPPRPANVSPPKGVYVKTSAQPKSCARHVDCYQMREPDEWCPLGEIERYLDKGCFCDVTRGLCTIQRLSETGAQYSDCAEQSTSSCSGLGNNIIKARQHLQQRK